MTILIELNKVIDNRHLLKHAYYQAWSAGKLDIEMLQRYASQYYLHVSTFPRFISTIHSVCPEINARKVLLENLVDEEIHGADHPSLWLQFAEGLGADKAAVLNTLPIPETKALIDKFNELASRNWRDGLCALYAYECQVPSVSVSKIAGLKEFYGISDEKTLEFFTAHQMYDVDHARKIGTLIEQYAESKSAIDAIQEATNALWGFLDGMCRIENIGCESMHCDNEMHVNVH